MCMIGSSVGEVNRCAACRWLVGGFGGVVDWKGSVNGLVCGESLALEQHEAFTKS